MVLLLTLNHTRVAGDDDVVVVVADDDDNNNHTVKTLVSKYNTKGENSLNLFRITSNCISYHSWQ